MAYEMKLSSPYGENFMSTYWRREPNRSPQTSGSGPYQNPLDVTNFPPNHPSQAVSFHSPHSLYQPSEFSNFWSTTGGYRSDFCRSYTNVKYHDNYSPHQHSGNWKQQEDLYATSDGPILFPHMETQLGGASSLLEDQKWNKETEVKYERHVFDEMPTCEKVEHYDTLASISENIMETKQWDSSYAAVEDSFKKGKVAGEHNSSISFVNRGSLESQEKDKELELELETVARALIESISENMKLREELSLTKDALHETTVKFEELELDHNELLEQEEGFEKLVEENDGLIIQVKDLQAEVKSLFEQKSTLEENISSTNNENNLLKEERERLLLKTFELENSLAKKVEEHQALQKRLEDVQKYNSTQIVALTGEVNKSRQQIELLQIEKDQLVLVIDRGKEESTLTLAHAENQNSELSEKIVDREIKLKEKDDAFRKLGEEHKQLEVILHEYKENLKLALMKIEELSQERDKWEASELQVKEELAKIFIEKGSLEDVVAELNNDVAQMKEFCGDLEAKLQLTDENFYKAYSLISQALENCEALEPVFGTPNSLEEVSSASNFTNRVPEDTILSGHELIKHGNELVIGGVHEVRDGDLDVLYAFGDSHFDGDDFDKRVEDLVAANFKRNEATIDGPKDIKATFARVIFEQLCSELSERFKTPVQNAFRDDSLSFTDTQNVFTVGGSTRILVQELVKNLTGKDPNIIVTPDANVPVMHYNICLEKWSWEAGGICIVSIVAGRLGFRCIAIGHNHGFGNLTDSSLDPLCSCMTELFVVEKLSIGQLKNLQCNGFDLDELFSAPLKSSLLYSFKGETFIFLDQGPFLNILVPGRPEEQVSLGRLLRMSQVIQLTSWVKSLAIDQALALYLSTHQVILFIDGGLLVYGKSVHELAVKACVESDIFVRNVLVNISCMLYYTAEYTPMLSIIPTEGLYDSASTRKVFEALITRMSFMTNYTVTFGVDIKVPIASKYSWELVPPFHLKIIGILDYLEVLSGENLHKVYKVLSVQLSTRLLGSSFANELVMTLRRLKHATNVMKKMKIDLGTRSSWQFPFDPG